MKQAGSANHAKKIWAFWGLGLLANRGVATDRVVEVLAAHVKEFDRSDRFVRGLPPLGSRRLGIGGNYADNRSLARCHAQ